MNKAIITGASGAIGAYLVKELLSNGIEVMAIGRRANFNSEIDLDNLQNDLSYCQLDLKDIKSLPKELKKKGWIPGNACVFYHFAWSGVDTLTDGTIEDQIKNVSFSSNAVSVAKELGCIKFVNSGSMEETFAEKYLKDDWINSEYHSNQGTYSVAKLSSKEMCLMTAYLEKIDYIHTRFSAVFNENLDLKGYISSSLKSILEGKKVSPPQNKQLFDLISIEDLAKAYYLIGKKGKNKANYFIGTGEPKTLTNYFTDFEKLVKKVNQDIQIKETETDYVLKHDDFDTTELKNDIGFKINNTFSNIKLNE